MIALISAPSKREYCAKNSAAGYVCVSKKIEHETNPATIGVAKTRIAAKYDTSRSVRRGKATFALSTVSFTATAKINS